MLPEPRPLILGFLIVLGLAAQPVRSMAASTTRPVVAVFDLENRASLARGDVVTLSEYITTLMAQGGMYRVVPKGEVQSALRAKKAESYQACYDESCQVEIGRELATQKTLSSKVSKLGATCIVTVQLYDLAQGASEGAGTAKGGCKVEQILALLDEAVSPLARPDGTAPAPSAVAKGAEAQASASAARPPALPPGAADSAMPKEPLPAELAALDEDVRSVPFMRKQRDRAVLETEIAELERLLAATPKTSDERPQLFERLGLSYGELEYVLRGRGGDAGDVSHSRMGTPAPEVLAARAKHIKNLDMLSRQYPVYLRADAVLFTLARAHERAGDASAARKTLLQLVQSVPQSPIVPRAYASFGELFWREAQLDLARTSFAEATKDPKLPTAAYAHYRVALIAVRAKDREGAVRSLNEARAVAEALGTNDRLRPQLIAAIDRALGR